MCKKLRPTTVAVVTLGTVLLFGCAHKSSTLASSANQAFTVDTPLDVIAADPDGMVVLVKDVPGVMFSSKYPLIEDMSLAQIAILAGGKIPKSKLNQVQGDLNKLAAKEAHAAPAKAAPAHVASAPATPAPAAVPAH